MEAKNYVQRTFDNLSESERDALFALMLSRRKRPGSQKPTAKQLKRKRIEQYKIMFLQTHKKAHIQKHNGSGITATNPAAMGGQSPMLRIVK